MNDDADKAQHTTVGLIVGFAVAFAFAAVLFTGTVALLGVGPAAPPAPAAAPATK